MNNKLLIVLSLFIAINGKTASAQSDSLKSFFMPEQETETVNSSDRYSSFQGIKSEIAQLLLQNKKLQAEQNELRKKSQIFQEDIEQLRIETKLLEKKARELRRSPLADERHVKKLYSDLEDYQSDISMKETRNLDLKDKLMGTSEIERLRRIKLADLQNQKNELQMDLKLKHLLYKQKTGNGIGAVDELREELSNISDKEKELSDKIKTIDKDMMSFDQKVNRLNEENKALENHILDMQRDIDIKIKENVNLQNKKLLASKSSDYETYKRQEKFVEFEQIVQGQQKKYNEWEIRLNLFMPKQKKMEKLNKEIVDFDKRNQVLRDRISVLERKIKESE